jgi:DNA-directed RNA polymerase specialized sigma24 family protein
MVWHKDGVRRLVVEAVRKKRGLFSRFDDIEEEDLVQEGMIRALDMHASYDEKRHKGKAAEPGKLPKAYSTWITRGVNYRLLDLWRKRSRQAKRDGAAAAVTQARQGKAVAQGEGARLEICVEDAGIPWPEEPRSLAFWLRDVYAKAAAAYPPRPRRGPPGFSQAKAIAIGALIGRMKLSTRAAAMFLKDKPELLAAIALPRVPSQRWLAKAKKSCSDNCVDRRPRGFKG